MAMNYVLTVDWTPELIDEQRTWINEYRDSNNLAWEEVANLVGSKGATMSLFGGNKYTGRNEQLAQLVLNFREHLAATTDILARVPNSPEFQLTRTSDDICEFLTTAQTFGYMAVIVGPPGIGKTITFERYQSRNPNVTLVTLSKLDKTPSQVVRAIGRVLGVGRQAEGGPLHGIGRQLQKRSSLIIIDEAQHANLEALDTVRFLNDEYKIAIVFGGNEFVESKCRAPDQPGFAQLTSRVRLRGVFRGSHSADFLAMCEAWGVEDQKNIDLLKKAAKRPGHLRNVDSIMKLAITLSRGDPDGPSARDLNHAYERLMGGMA